jgi:hypothetical protein
VSIRKISTRWTVLLGLAGLALAVSPAAFAQNAAPSPGKPLDKPIQGRGTPVKNTPNSVWKSPSPDNSPFDPRNLNGNWEGVVRNTTGKEVSAFTPQGKSEFDANKPLNACAGYNDPKSDCASKLVGISETNDPYVYCDPLGFPRMLFYQMRHMEMVQTPTKVVQLFQYNDQWREIWTDGRTLPANVGKPGGPDPRWSGYSIGHWDGDIFVVNTVGSDDRSWLDPYGDPHSLDMKVEEKYTRMDHDRLKLVVTVDDPKIYTKPFVAQPGLIFHLEASQSLPEQMCVPSEEEQYRSFAAGADGVAAK